MAPKQIVLAENAEEIHAEIAERQASIALSVLSVVFLCVLSEKRSGDKIMPLVNNTSGVYR